MEPARRPGNRCPGPAQREKHETDMKEIQTDERLELIAAIVLGIILAIIRAIR